jgi:hypothetical protein
MLSCMPFFYRVRDHMDEVKENCLHNENLILQSEIDNVKLD